MGEEEPNEIVTFRPPGSELIDGVPVMLGRMSLGQLLAIKAGVQSRIDEAHTDLWVIEDVITRRFPEPGNAS
jgi:hypothetical protein